MNRKTAIIVAWSVLAIHLQIARALAAEEAEPPEAAGVGELLNDNNLPKSSAVRPILGDVQIDVSALKSPAWQAAIRRATEYPALRAGGQVTLLRVLCEDGHRNLTDRRYDEAPIVVNGVRLFLPPLINRIELAVYLESSQPARAADPDKIQLASIKLVKFDDFPNGGGMYQELLPGEFVLVEHINSTRRESGRDPVTIGSFTHHHAKIGVVVPPPGQLGIAGDVVLARPARESLGRVVAELVPEGEAPIEVRQFQIGPVVVGGKYGRRFDFNQHGVCSTDQLSPGQYRILLPDFDMVKSRWDITVKPSEVTYLRFIASSQKQVRLEHEKHISFGADN